MINTETSPRRGLELLCSPQMNLCTKTHQNSVVHNINITHVYPTCKCSNPLWRFCFRLWVQFKAASQISLVNAVSQTMQTCQKKPPAFLNIPLTNTLHNQAQYQWIMRMSLPTLARDLKKSHGQGCDTYCDCKEGLGKGEQ